MSKQAERKIVVGEGWAALASVLLLHREYAGRLIWIKGSGARVLPVLPGLDANPGARAWEYLAGLHGIETGPLASGNFLREFRNKGFRHPLWVKAPTPEKRAEVREAELWSSELQFCTDFEARFANMTVGELDEQLRAVAASLSDVEVIDGDAITAAYFAEGAFTGLKLSSGREIKAGSMIFADRWTDVASVSGLPKPFPGLRGREAVSALQLSFTHSAPVGGTEPRPEGFFGPIQREANEDFQRQVWGHFSSDGRKSHWTVALEAKELEDNHEIAKKIRRMKQAVEKMFTGPSWLPEGSADLISTITDEQVRFEEFVFFDGRKPVHQALTVEAYPGVHFMTDGYGPAAAFEQAFKLLAAQVELGQPLTSEWESGLATAEPTEAPAELAPPVDSPA